MKKAVMYGAGNIGRGFITQLFYMSGYETVFVDVVDAVVEMINKDKGYPIFITNGDKYDTFEVKNVRAVNGKVIEDVAREIAEADIMATAVGVNILKFIAQPIAEGIKKRCAEGKGMFNIIICENMIGADSYLRDLVSSYLNDEEKKYFNDMVGLVEPSIGRMVPATPDDIKAKYPLAVCVEPYCVLPVDKHGFKGEIPEIKNMQPSAPFEFYIQRKLFMHNMSHAITAYLGNLAGYTYIWEAIGDYRIRYTVLGALMEISTAMCKEHGVPFEEALDFSFDLIDRFGNKLLGDTIARVGKDTQRKLSSNDRLVGAYNLCVKHNIKAPHLAIGIAAALHFAPEGDDSSLELKNFAKENGVAQALIKYSGFKCEKCSEKIASIYEELKNGLDGALI